MTKRTTLMVFLACLLLLAVSACQQGQEQASATAPDPMEPTTRTLPPGHRVLFRGVEAESIENPRSPTVLSSREEAEDFLSTLRAWSSQDYMKATLDETEIHFPQEVIVAFPHYTYVRCDDEHCMEEDVPGFDAFIIDTEVTRGKVQMGDRMFPISGFRHYQKVLSTRAPDGYDAADDRTWLLTAPEEVQEMQDYLLAAQFGEVLNQDTRPAFTRFILSPFPLDFSTHVALAAVVSDTSPVMWELEDRTLSTVEREPDIYTPPTATRRRFVLFTIDRQEVDSAEINGEVFSWAQP